MKTDRNTINESSIYSHRRNIEYVDAENKPSTFRLEEISWDHLVQLPTTQAGSARTCCPGPYWDGFGISAQILLPLTSTQVKIFMYFFFTQ